MAAGTVGRRRCGFFISGRRGAGNGWEESSESGDEDAEEPLSTVMRGVIGTDTIMLSSSTGTIDLENEATVVVLPLLGECMWPERGTMRCVVESAIEVCRESDLIVGTLGNAR